MSIPSSRRFRNLVLSAALALAMAMPPAARAADTPAAGSATNRPVVIVFAAAGATDVVTQLCREYEAGWDVETRLNFASSSTLARQLEAGAQADIYISASKQWMDYVCEKQLSMSETRSDWADNRLVLVVPKQTTAIGGASASPGDPGQASLSVRLSAIQGRIAIGDPEHVPAGIYARQALESADLYVTLKDQFVACPSVRAALRLVEAGQVEAGIVYQSDAVVSRHVDVVATFPQSWHEPIAFQLALLRGHQPSAEPLAEFLTSARATDVLPQFGFDTGQRDFTEIAAPKETGVPLWHLTEAERKALWFSLKVALVSMLLLTGPGILLGYLLARKRFVGKSIVEGLVHAPLVLPPIVTGYLLLLVLGHNGFIGRWLRLGYGIELAFTFRAAALASAIVALPLMVRSVRVAMAVADRGLEQASYALGAGPARTFLLVSLPLAAPGVIAGMVLAFARSLGEFGATAVFMGNIEGQKTLPLAIYSALQTAHGEQTAWKLVAISVVVSLAAVTASEILTRRAGRYLEPRHVA